MAPPSSDPTRPADESTPPVDDDVPPIDSDPISPNDSPHPLNDSPPPPYSISLPPEENPPQIDDSPPPPPPVHSSPVLPPVVIDSKPTVPMNDSLPPAARTHPSAFSTRRSHPKEDVVTSSTNNQLPFTITTKVPTPQQSFAWYAGGRRQKQPAPGRISLAW